jgi:hypothetical protein
MSRKKVVKLVLIGMIVVITSTYGITAAFSAGLFAPASNPNIIWQKGTELNFGESGTNPLYNNTTGTVWFGGIANPSTVMRLTGSWSSTAPLKLILVSTPLGLKNHTLVYSLLNATSPSYSGSVNVTIAPSLYGTHITFVPSPNEGGTVKITQQFILSPL